MAYAAPPSPRALAVTKALHAELTEVSLKECYQLALIALQAADAYDRENDTVIVHSDTGTQIRRR